jgi:hypothetical protein
MAECSICNRDVPDGHAYCETCGLRQQLAETTRRLGILRQIVAEQKQDGLLWIESANPMVLNLRQALDRLYSRIEAAPCNCGKAKGGPE